MERWAANTLRILGIVVLGHLILVLSLALLLLSICSWDGVFGGGSKEIGGIGFLLATVAVLAIGIWVIARLARGVMRSMPAGAVVPDANDTSERSVPFHFSPSGLQAVRLIAGAMTAQIALSAVGWFWSQFQFWRVAMPMRPHNWVLILLVPFVLYHVPYVVLIQRLLQRPSRRELAYSLAIPGVIVFQSLFSLALVTSVYVRQPVGFLLLAVPWLLHILVLALAYRAIQITGLHPEPSLLLRAALVTVVYFFLVHLTTPLLYLIRR